MTPKDIIDESIKKYVAEICSKKEIPDGGNFVETDNIGEVIDKLIIVHIRAWMLEDTIHNNISDADLALTKRKLDVCFKQKRPKLVEAINKLIDKAVIEGKSLVEDNVKIYKSEDNK
jgi:galactitol-specific phosphotransferase system IIB component